MTNEVKNQIITLRAQGNGYKKIAMITGLSADTVKSFCRRKAINSSSVCKTSDTSELSGCQQNTTTSLDCQVNPTNIYPEKIDTCLCCGKPIQQISKQKPKKFCSDRCRNKWWISNLNNVKHRANHSFTCQHCGKTFFSYGNKLRKYCSHSCYIEQRFGGVSA